ncbi:hypothetical protein ABIC16_004267 [Sphingomonas sp. PvP055]|uniref:hypothetical protein n=1 Tax=Sphingomonas sp. PvP055 TaxID=3156391 RepID=UPI00339B7053
MAKRSCIICGGATGSREHLFPAALGGRRVNAGIYCSEHNQALGPGAAVLAKQLRVINSILMVESDRDRKVAHYPVTVEDGRTLNVVGGHATLAARFDVTSDTPEVTTGTLNFQTDAQFQAWVKAQHDAGNRVEFGERQINPPKFYPGPRLELTFGGSNGLRAIAYLALTYFAHHFADAARTPALHDFKAYVLGQEAATRAGWAPVDAFANLPVNPFEFGHMIAVGVDTNGKAKALVSIFGSLNFAVDIAQLAEAEEARAMATFINPLARGAPADIHEVAIEPGGLGTVETDRSQQTLETAIADGIMQSALRILFEKISIYVNRRDATPLLMRLENIAARPVSDRSDAIATLLNEQLPTTMILQLCERVVSGLKLAFGATPETVPFIAMLDELLAFDPVRPSGLSENTETLMPAMRDIIGQQLLAATAGGVISIDILVEILAGERGARSISEMYVSVLNQLSNQLSADSSLDRAGS